ncbi:MAG: glycoside hydrolase family 3 N-terminal domain-containing protein, partial [Bacteroidota bacterium]
GTPMEQAALANDLQSRSRLPLLVSQDAEWGIGMRVERSTSLPRMMAVGASRNPDNAYLAGYVTAREARALGVHQIFAPVADLNLDPDNPIINVRSFGDDAEMVASMVTAFVSGAEDGGAIATPKHFPGHGDTDIDSHSALPSLSVGTDRLDSLEFVPFQAAIREGVRSIMVGHLALPQLEPDPTVPATLSRVATTGLLREHLGFDGLIVTDALNMRAITGSFSPGEAAVRALVAGADMLMMPTDIHAAHAAVLEAVEEGRLTEDRIDESVRRILQTKQATGLATERLVDLDRVRDVVHINAHRAAANEIARDGLTLLSNEEELIPIRSTPTRILMPIVIDGAGEAQGRAFSAEARRHVSDGSALSVRRIDAGAGDADYRAIRAEASRHDLVLLPVFTRVRAGSGRIGLSEKQVAFINELIDSETPTVIVSLGDPYLLLKVNEPAAYLATFSGSEASEVAAAQALFGAASITGRLPVTLSEAYRSGRGIDVAQQAPRSGYPEEVGMRTERMGAVDTLIRGALRNRAFPGAAVAVGRGDVIPLLKGYGYHTYARSVGVTPDSRFDLASLTKVIATTTAAMKLFEQGRLDLDAPIAHYLPEFGTHGKERVTVRQALTHQTGLVPFIPFHRRGVVTREAVIDTIMAQRLQYRPGTDTRYSDLGMISLALAMERIVEMPFQEYARDSIFIPLGMHDTSFLGTGIPDPGVVPTEIDRDFRRRLLQGEVHDEAAWILGGAAGHAGLFSTAPDLARFAYMMINEGRIGGRQFLRPETIRLFTTRVDPNGSTRALGWDTRTLNGNSSAGTLFGPRSFGHTGFTGTSIWFDPDQRLYVILLTNRVHPTRENSRHVLVRSALADIVYRSIEGPDSLLLLDELRPNLPTDAGQTP